MVALRRRVGGAFEPLEAATAAEDARRSGKHNLHTRAWNPRLRTGGPRTTAGKLACGADPVRGRDLCASRNAHPAHEATNSRQVDAVDDRGAAIDRHPSRPTGASWPKLTICTPISKLPCGSATTEPLDATRSRHFRRLSACPCGTSARLCAGGAPSPRPLACFRCLRVGRTCRASPRSRGPVRLDRNLTLR